MGAIDFDPFTTPDLNRLVCAAKIYDRNEGDLETAIAMDWDIPGEKRVFAGCAHGAEWTRKLMNKTIREYRKGNVDQAILWVSNNETLTKCPWVWEFPVCIPFGDCARLTGATNLKRTDLFHHLLGLLWCTSRPQTRKVFTPSFLVSTTPFSISELLYSTS